MTRQDLKSRMAVLLVLGLGLAGSGATSQTHTAPVLARLNPAQLLRVKSAMNTALPQGATEPMLQQSQAMIVNGEVTVAPIKYQAPVSHAIAAGITASTCGVYVAMEGGSSTFVPTLDESTSVGQCGDLVAIGAATQKNRPDLILVYRAYTVRDNFFMTVLLVWDPQGKTYAVDEKLTDWLSQQDQGQTVAGARRLLAKKSPPALRAATSSKGK